MMNPNRGCPDCEANVEFFGLQADACDLCRKETREVERLTSLLGQQAKQNLEKE